MDVVFLPRTAWTLPPVKARTDRKTAEEDAQIYAQSFRWFRRTRTPALCWPWRLAQEIGWVVPSPVDVLMTPIRDVEVAMPNAERSFFSQKTGLTDIQQRDESLVAMEKAGWIHLYEADFEGDWEPMFVALGNGVVEWRLGWGIEIPEDFYLMVLPTGDLPEIEVIPSVLDKTRLDEIGARFGMAISFRVLREVEISRRRPIARIMLLHASSVQAQGRLLTPDAADATASD